MKRALIFLFLLSGSVGCKDNEYTSPEILATPCVSVFKDLRRKGDLMQAPVLFIGGRFYYLTHLDSTTIDLRYATPILPCNLPSRYRRDTLRALVSGYHLTNNTLELSNFIPLPFELTDIELKK